MHMKTCIFLLVVVLCSVSASVAQTLEMDSTTGKLMYRRVVKLDSVEAGVLYERARQWLVRAYKSADDVLQYENKTEGKLMGRGLWIPAASVNNEKNEHVIIIECRDGRVRYTFTDFVRETYDTTLGRQRKALEAIKFMKKASQDYYAKEAARMGGELEKALLSKDKKDDGW